MTNQSHPNGDRSPAERSHHWRVLSDGEWRLLDRFVAGDFGADELEAMRTLVARDPALHTLSHLMRHVGAEDGNHAPAWQTERAWQSIQVRRLPLAPMTGLRLVDDGEDADAGVEISAGDAATTVVVSGGQHAEQSGHRMRAAMSRRTWSTPKRALMQWVTIGGAVCALLIVGLLTWFQGEQKSGRDPVFMREFTTHEGQRATIELTDGTLVTLGPHTHLQISQSFGDADRIVKLSGEAFFDVQQHTKLPLLVRSEYSSVRVLGTQFNVRARGPDVTVAVMEGRVALEPDRDGAPGAIVTAGYVGTMSNAGDVEIRQGDIDRHTAWMRDRLSFRNTEVTEVLDELERWYGVNFIVPESTAIQRRLTAEWENRSLGSVLRSLSVALNIDVVMEGNNVILRAR